MTRRWIGLLALALLLPGAGAAQGTVEQDSRLVPGARLRITTLDGTWRRTEASFVGVRGDTLVVETPRPAQAAIPLSGTAVQVLARPARRRAYAWRGAAAGALIAFLAGEVAFAGKGARDGIGAEHVVAAGVAVPGALLGMVAGFELGGERWRTVRVWPGDPVPASRVGLRLAVP